MTPKNFLIDSFTFETTKKKPLTTYPIYKKAGPPKPSRSLNVLKDFFNLLIFRQNRKNLSAEYLFAIPHLYCM